MKETTPFDYINFLTIEKKKWEELTESEIKDFKPFIIIRWLSMNQDINSNYLFILHQIQYLKIDISDKKIVYKLLLSLLPKDKIYVTYIKEKAGNKKYNSDLVEYFERYFMLSNKECNNIISKMIQFNYYDDIEKILKKFGLDKKQREKILPKKTIEEDE